MTTTVTSDAPPAARDIEQFLAVAAPAWLVATATRHDPFASTRRRELAHVHLARAAFVGDVRDKATVRRKRGIGLPAIRCEERLGRSTVEEANRKIEGMEVYATIDSEVLDRLQIQPGAHVLSVDKGRNFEMLSELLGRGTELPRTTHADGAERSWTLYFYPDVVRLGYDRLPQSTSSRFFEASSSGDCLTGGREVA